MSENITLAFFFLLPCGYPTLGSASGCCSRFNHTSNYCSYVNITTNSCCSFSCSIICAYCTFWDECVHLSSSKSMPYIQREKLHFFDFYIHCHFSFLTIEPPPFGYLSPMAWFIKDQVVPTWLLKMDVPFMNEPILLITLTKVIWDKWACIYG